ncbi:MAG TPA: hypothetical protein VLJ21_00380 [Candidatus Binatia bacterium]|nr:hypothetical protein [Candidatus Binatia bacterium]
MPNQPEPVQKHIDAVMKLAAINVNKAAFWQARNEDRKRLAMRCADLGKDLMTYVIALDRETDGEFARAVARDDLIFEGVFEYKLTHAFLQSERARMNRMFLEHYLDSAFRYDLDGKPIHGEQR